MHPSQFVALLGSSPETGWPALTGRDDNSIGRESRNNGRIWFWNLLFLRKPKTTGKRTFNRKEVFDEKDCSDIGRSFGGGSCRTRYSQMEKISKQGVKIK